MTDTSASGSGDARATSGNRAAAGRSDLSSTRSNRRVDETREAQSSRGDEARPAAQKVVEKLNGSQEAVMLPVRANPPVSFPTRAEA